MHATSAIAVAVVALNAAGVMSIPMGPSAFAHRASSHSEVIANSTHAETNTSTPMSTVPGNAKAPSHALPTVTVPHAPKPTQCKPGETPTTRKHRNRKASSHRGKGYNHHGPTRQHHGDTHQNEHHRGHPAGLGASAIDTEQSRSTPTRALVLRAGVPAPTAPALAYSNPAHAHAHVPTPTPHSHHKDGNKPHGTQTTTGADGTATVRVPGTSTPCYAVPTGRAPVHGHKGLSDHDMSRFSHGDAEAAALPLPTDTEKQVPKPARAHKAALVKRTVDLIERYFDELDELD